jgi:hypothetical protein
LLELPVGGHFSPGVVAVAGNEADSLFFSLDGQVTVYGEDLAVDPVGE